MKRMSIVFIKALATLPAQPTSINIIDQQRTWPILTISKLTMQDLQNT